MGKKKAVKKTAKKVTKKAAAKYSFVDDLHQRVMDIAEVTARGEIRLKKTDLKKAMEEAFSLAAKESAGGVRVRFPVIGSLVSKDVKAVKAGKYNNPFTGEEAVRAARPATKKPRWSFPKALKETFSNKRNW